MERALNAIKDGYLKVIDFIDNHPQAGFWMLVGIVGLYVFYRLATR